MRNLHLGAVVVVVIVVLVGWFAGSLFYSIGIDPGLQSFKTTGTLHYHDSYLSDGYNYTDYTVIPADGYPSFGWAFSCTYFHDGSIVQVQHTGAGVARWWFLYPILGGSKPVMYEGSVISDARGC
jgi:hypothetical protein